MADPIFLKKMETDLSRKQAELMVLCRSMEKKERKGEICKKTSEVCISTIRKLIKEMMFLIEKSTNLRLDIKWKALPNSNHTIYLNKYEKILRHYNLLIPNIVKVRRMLEIYR